ncbi:MAG: MFS transporter [Actinomycetota bacterium]
MGEVTAIRDTERGITPLAATYVVFGWFWGSIAVLLANLQAANDLSSGRLGLYLSFTSITGIVTMTVVAPRLEHLARHITIPVSLALHGSGALLLATLSPTLLPLAFLMIGLGTGMVDVLVNAVGYEREVRSGRAVLQWVHMSYSIGAGVGALATGVILTAGASFRTALILSFTLQVLVAAVIVTSRSLRSVPARERSETKVSLTAFRKWPWLLVPALIVGSAFFVEGSMDVWSGVYLRKTLGASVMTAAIGFAAFAFATSAGRALAAKILFGFGYRATVIASGLGAVLAGAVAATAPNTTVAACAYLVLGFSLSAAAPAAFGSVEGGNAGLAIAAVTTVGYAGFVVGPPFMGWLADATGSFRITMFVITAATLGVLIGGLLTRKRREAVL